VNFVILVARSDARHELCELRWVVNGALVVLVIHKHRRGSVFLGPESWAELWNASFEGGIRGLQNPLAKRFLFDARLDLRLVGDSNLLGRVEELVV
jgi:hypothetical protein